MSGKSKLNVGILGVAVLGSLVFINIIGVKVFGRLDLTRDGQFTLSEATKDTLRVLHDPVTVRAYFTEKMPSQHASTARYVQDLLEEYYAHGDGYFRYEFIDPITEETAEDKEKKKDVKKDVFGRAVREMTSIEREMQSLGIKPFPVRVAEDDKLEVQRVYMGIAIHYGEKTEVIPKVERSVGLEYNITTLVRKLTREKTPQVAFVTADDSVDIMEEMGRLYQGLTQYYDVTTINLSTQPEIADEVDAILVFGGKTPYTGEAQKELDEFVMSGRSAAFLLDAVKLDLTTLSTEDQDHGLGPMLATYGAKIEEGLVLDVQCATINVQQVQGYMRIMKQVRYVYMPVVKSLDPQHPLTRGLAQVAFPFMSPLSLSLPEDTNVKGEILVKSSDKSWVETPPYTLDPDHRWTLAEVGEQLAQSLLLALSGPIPSHFGAQVSSAEEEGSLANNARVLVAGGSSFMRDNFASPTNQALILNLLDWLVLDEALLAVRSRGLVAAPLDELGDGTRSLVKYGNVFGWPAALVAFGLVRWRRRESRRDKVSL